MADKSLFPMVTQFGFDPGESTNPDLHLVFTIWIESTQKRVVMAINSGLLSSDSQRVAYGVFETTGLMQAGLVAFRLVDVRLERPSDLPLLTYQQAFEVTHRQRCVEDFLSGIVPHA
jgi:hypothetical protein